MKNRTINVKGADIAIASRHEQDDISPTDMVKNFDGGSALIEQWLKNKDTVLFLGVWEQINNQDLIPSNSRGLKRDRAQQLFLSAKNSDMYKAEIVSTL